MRSLLRSKEKLITFLPDFVDKLGYFFLHKIVGVCALVIFLMQIEGCPSIDNCFLK